MSSARLAKVNALIEVELGQALRDHLQQPGLLATVVRVQTAADLSEADTWISTLPDGPEPWDQVIAALPRLQAHLASRLRMKRTPKLKLHHDHSAAHAQRIDELLREKK